MRQQVHFNQLADLRRVLLVRGAIGVEAIRFDSSSYKAVATLRIDSQFNRIPDDSDASVQTQGLLGGKYIGIGPGGSDTYFKDGGRIELTQSAIVLENLINKLFASFLSKDSGNAQSGGAANESK